MSKDVFISHSGKDRICAEKVCQLLEQNEISCWIAPRDIVAGTVFDEAILDAIEAARVMVLILSENANESPFVKTEVNRAFSKGKAIVTFRSENVVPSRSLELYLARHHWIEGFPPPLEGKINQLASAIQSLLQKTSTHPSFASLPVDDELELLMHRNCWVSYDPLTFNPECNPNPAEKDIDIELKWIRSAGFTGIVTYGSRGTLATIPRLAKRHNLRVITGVWDPSAGSDEMESALGTGESTDAFCVGHHGLNRRYSYADLIGALERLRQQTGRPVATTEAARLYENDPRLLKAGDWLFPDVQFSFRDAVTEPDRIDLARDVPRILKLANDMAKLALSPRRLLMFKMVLCPHKGALGASAENQKTFFQGLYDGVRSPEYGLPVKVSFVFHSAFDSSWKSGRPFFPWDPYTGLLNDNGTPRPAALEIVSSFGACTIH